MKHKQGEKLIVAPCGTCGILIRALVGAMFWFSATRWLALLL